MVIGRARIRRAAAVLLAAASGALVAGCAGEERPWEAHLKDKDRGEQGVPNLTPPAPATPTTPAGGLNPENAEALPADPGAPPPVTDATPGTRSEQEADDDPSATSAPERGDDTTASGKRESDRPDTNATARTRSSPSSTQASGRLDDSRRRASLPRPNTNAERIAADKRAMLNLRTMVSIIEGCNSGRESYAKCNTHGELGAPEILGLEIGRAEGQIQISATRRGFRLTTVSRSGTKFTMARGPAGDRFRCIPGPDPGACPASRTWGW